MKEIIEKREIQFIIQIVLLVLAVAIPFVTYGARIEQLEKRADKVDTVHQELSMTLTDMQVRLAQIQKDIEYLKLKK